jgi:hypothetical protein
MMSGGIQIFDMIKRHKENESLRKNIKYKYFKAKGTYIRAAGSLNIDYRTATKEELQEIRTKIAEYRRMDRIKSVLAIAMSFLVTGTLIFLLLEFVRP